MIDRAWLDRLTAIAGIVGAICLASAYLTHPTTPAPEIVASRSWAIIHTGFLLSLISGIFLLFALFARLARNGATSVLGVLGFVMASISLMFVIGLDYAEIFIFPELAVTFPIVVATYGDGTMMPSVAFAFGATGAIFMLGFILFGLALAKARVISRPWAAVLIVGTIAFGLGLSGLFPMVVVRVGACLFSLGLVGMALALTSQPAADRG